MQHGIEYYDILLAIFTGICLEKSKEKQKKSGSYEKTKRRENCEKK